MNIKKILYLFIIGLVLFGINNSCFAYTEYDYTGRFNIGTSVFKTNDHGDALVGAKFKIYDVNNTFYLESKDENNGLYGFSYSKEDEVILERSESTIYQFVMNTLPNDVRNDVIKYLTTGETNHLNTTFYDISGHSIIFPVPLIIEETTAPSGYVKGDKIIVLAKVIAYEPDWGSISVSLELYDCLNYYKFNKEVNYNAFVSYLTSQKATNDVVRLSDLNFNSSALENTGISYDPIVLFNEKGDIKLQIKNYVNNLARYTTSRGKTLSYRIEVENTGTLDSTDNVIVTQIPTELEYVSGSASDGGVYDKDKHTITWRVDNIEANSKISFRYSALVPKDVTVGVEFIGSSTITCKEVGEVKSRETNVSLITNPKTAAPIAVIVLLVSMMGVIKVIKNHNKEKELDV